MDYLNFKQITYYFNNYKKRPTHHNLSCLYTEIDPLVVDVTSNISRQFRQKYPADFEDLQQLVRLEVFQVLDKICSISLTGKQLAKILVKVSIYSFIDHYNKYKKQQFIKNDKSNNKALNDSEIVRVDNTDYEYSFYDDIDRVIGKEGPLGNYTSHNYIKAQVYTDSTQEQIYYINSIKNKLKDKIISLNRYKDKQDLVLFCFNSLFSSRDVSPKILQKIWKIDNPEFWTDYSEVLLKIAIYDVLTVSRTTRGNFKDTSGVDSR